MRIESDARRVQVYLGEEDRAGHRSLVEAIVEMLKGEGIAGATVVRGTEGFGASHILHSANVLRLSENLPVVVTFVDTVENVEAVLPRLDAMIGSGLVVVDDVRIIAYRAEGRE